MVKFSLVVCNYNNGKFFEKCFESIINQTYTNLEVIIIDDNSTDDSVEIIQGLINNYPQFKLYINEQNHGYAFSLHRGVELSTGEFVGRVDPDDALIVDAVEVMVKRLLEKDVVAAYSQMLVCDENMDPIKTSPTTQKVRNNNLHFFNIFFEVTHFFTFKKQVYKSTCGINTELTSSVDQDLYLKLYEKGNFAYISETLYLYRTHQGGISQDKSKKERLNLNRNKVLRDTMIRRGIKKLYSKPIDEIESLQHFIWKKQNTILKKILRRISLL